MAEIKYESPGLKFPAPTADDDGKVLGYSVSGGFAWVTGGATGPAGPTGPTGATGPTGPGA